MLEKLKPLFRFGSVLQIAFFLQFNFAETSLAIDKIPVKCESIFQNKLEIDSQKFKEFVSTRGKSPNGRVEIIDQLFRFGRENSLPMRIEEFGPPDRLIKRLVVAVDIKNTTLMERYRNEFNLNASFNREKADSGTLVIEQTWENRDRPEHYVYTYIRSSANPDDPVYRWDKRDSSWKSSFLNLLGNNNNGKGYVGIAHLIGLNKAEKENVGIFLDNPELRGPCKSTNCVAWLTGVELGETGAKKTDSERKYLFNELGISRTIAPFEISRRLVHAANEGHGAMIVFVDGEKGIDSFVKTFREDLIPEPKIPYASILKNYNVENPAKKAMSILKDGSKVFLPIAAGASPQAVEAMIDLSRNLKKGLDLHVLVNGVSERTFREGVETTDGKFRVHALFLGGNLRELYKDKKVSVIPGNLSDFSRMTRDPDLNDFKYDAIVVRVSPPKNGYHSLGPNADMIVTLIRDLPNIKIIAEVNPNVPFTNGDNMIPASRIHAQFDSNTELAGPTTVPLGEIDQKIGNYIGSLVDSYSTLQIGIGNIFGGVPEGLKKHKKTGLKISTEMFGDHMMEMINNGIATQAHAGFAFGTSTLYKWLNENPKVQFVSTEWVNSPGRIAQTPNFHAINTALQVDLFGQVNATMGPDGRISSPGGQVEFMSGASRSEGGKAIIAIRSTAKNGTISSIVLDLYRGPITTPHENVSHVVTEYGIAFLKGKTEVQRAIALINIAHPKFRKELTDKAIQRNILTEFHRQFISGEEQ